MHSSRPSGRGRLVAAVAVSLTLHALIGAAWLHSRGRASGAGASINLNVDGPVDHDVAFTLRERPADPVPTPAPLVKPTSDPAAPAPLPKDILPPPPVGPGAVSLVSGSLSPPSDLPKFGGARPIHGRPRPSTTVVYVLDRSASMGPDGLLRRATNAVLASLDQLSPDTHFQVVAYNSGATTLAPRPLSATADAKDRADRWLATLTAEGGSNHRVAFRDALEAKPDELYLLTDADDLEESDVRAIAALIRTPVRLSAAVFSGHRPAALTPLDRLVGRFNGAVRYIEP